MAEIRRDGEVAMVIRCRFLEMQFNAAEGIWKSHLDDTGWKSIGDQEMVPLREVRWYQFDIAVILL